MVKVNESTFNILIADKNMDVSHMLAFHLENQFGANVFEAQDAASALDFLKTTHSIQLLIVDATEESFKDLITYISSEQAPESLYVILSIENKIKDPTLLMHPNILGVALRNHITREVPQLLKEKFFDGEITSTIPTNEFCRIRATLLLLTTPLAGDVYIRLSEEKFLKLFKKGDIFEARDLERYVRQKQIEYFYVKHEDSAHFLLHFEQEAEKIIKNAHVETSVIRTLAQDAHESVYWMINQIGGVTKEVQEMTKTNVKLVIRAIGNQPTLSSLFDRIHREMGQYIVSHSLLLSEVSCVLAANVTWLSDLTFQKLVLAAMFHDITIKNHELAKISDMKEAQDHPEQLKLETLEDFRHHPLHAAELVNQLHNVPPDVDNIIRQHHERPNGSGFPHGIGIQYFSPLSCVFIIAHDFVDYALKNSDLSVKVSILDFFEKHKLDYSQGYFKKIIKTLEDRYKQELHS